ncbi:Ku protein [Herbaspirillum sp. GCM10030257]|uniref:Ku protein n=1 Tax=Herbaspirillum sp. GCM10030257 TaxID=3273393 RepID=UPI003606C8D2
MRCGVRAQVDVKARRLGLPFAISHVVDIPERLFVISPDTQRYTTASRATHAVDILAFVGAQEIPSDYYETPYYLQPAPGGEKAYALLRETLRESRKIGIAYVVIRARQHLAALVPEGQSLVLNTLRWASESGSAQHFGLPEEEVLVAQELAMMAAPLDTASYRGSLDIDAADRSPDMNAFVEQSALAGDAPEIVVEELDDMVEDNNMADDYLAYVLSSSIHPRGVSARRDRTSHQPASTVRRRMTSRRG